MEITYEALGPSTSSPTSSSVSKQMNNLISTICMKVYFRIKVMLWKQLYKGVMKRTITLAYIKILLT